jgi:hypothetical protein
MQGILLHEPLQVRFRINASKHQYNSLLTTTRGGEACCQMHDLAAFRVRILFLGKAVNLTSTRSEDTANA